MFINKQKLHQLISSNNLNSRLFNILYNFVSRSIHPQPLPFHTISNDSCALNNKWNVNGYLLYFCFHPPWLQFLFSWELPRLYGDRNLCTGPVFILWVYCGVSSHEVLRKIEKFAKPMLWTENFQQLSHEWNLFSPLPWLHLTRFIV